MPFDVLLICLDWAIVWVSAADAGLAQWSRTLTMLRFLRLARMLRWVKLQRVNEVFQELLHSQADHEELMIVFMQMFMPMFGINKPRKQM